METVEIVQAVLATIDSLGIVGVLAWGWVQERKRAERLEAEIVSDWKRQNDRETISHLDP